MPVRLCSKSFKLGFSSMWTKIQRYKLGFEEVEEPEIKLLTFVGSWGKRGSSRKTSINTCASLTTLKPLTVWITTNCGKSLMRWEHQTTLPASWKTCMQVKKHTRSIPEASQKSPTYSCDKSCKKFQKCKTFLLRNLSAEAETPILWPPDAKSQLIRRDPDAGKDWRQKEKQAAEMRWLDIVSNSMEMILSKCAEIVENRRFWCATVHEVAKRWTLPSDWTTAAILIGP